MTETQPIDGQTRVTDEEIQELREAHRDWKRAGQCAECESSWPCPTVRLIEENKALRGSLDTAHEMLLHVREVKEKILRERDALLERLKKADRLAEALEAVSEALASRSAHACAGWDCASCVDPSVRGEIEVALADYRGEEA